MFLLFFLSFVLSFFFLLAFPQAFFVFSFFFLTLSHFLFFTVVVFLFLLLFFFLFLYFILIRSLILLYFFSIFLQQLVEEFWFFILFIYLFSISRSCHLYFFPPLHFLIFLHYIFLWAQYSLSPSGAYFLSVEVSPKVCFCFLLFFFFFFFFFFYSKLSNDIFIDFSIFILSSFNFYRWSRRSVWTVYSIWLSTTFKKLPRIAFFFLLIQFVWLLQCISRTALIYNCYSMQKYLLI